MLQLQVCSQTKTLEERVNFVRKCGGCRKLRTVILYSNLIGFYSLAIIYFAFAFSNLFLATLIVSKVGNRLSMVFGGLGYCLFIASFEYVILPVFYGFSALMGFCASILWTAQGNYLTLNSTEETRGRNSGLFWALLQTSLLLGSGAAFIIVPPGSEIALPTARLLFLVMLVSSCAGVVLFLFQRPPPSLDETEREVLLDTPANELPAAQARPWTQEVLRPFFVMVEADMLRLVMILILSGTELTFWSGKYPTMIGGTDASVPPLPSSFQPKIIPLYIMCVGAGEVSAGLVFGRVVDQLGRNFVMVVGLGCMLAAYILTYFNFLSSYLSPVLWLALVTGVLFGMGDSILNTVIYALLGSLYPTDKSIPAFALWKFFQSAFAGLAFLYSDHLPLIYQLSFLVSTIFLGGVGYAWTSHRQVQAAKHPLPINVA